MLESTSVDMKSLPPKPLPLNKAARSLCVPAGWLRAEVEARRLPALRAGRAILIDVPTVAKLLAQRAQQIEGNAEPEDCEK
jgi:hypothetical protein